MGVCLRLLSIVLCNRERSEASWITTNEHDVKSKMNGCRPCRVENEDLTLANFEVEGSCLNLYETVKTGLLFRLKNFTSIDCNECSILDQCLLHPGISKAAPLPATIIFLVIMVPRTKHIMYSAGNVGGRKSLIEQCTEHSEKKSLLGIRDIHIYFAVVVGKHI
jgi:hypothetical protein